MYKPAFTVLVELEGFLEPADPIGFWVVTLNCSNVKNVVEQDILCTKRIVNFTSFSCLSGWSAVVDGHRFKVKDGSSKHTCVC